MSSEFTDKNSLNWFDPDSFSYQKPFGIKMTWSQISGDFGTSPNIECEICGFFTEKLCDHRLKVLNPLPLNGK